MLMLLARSVSPGLCRCVVESHTRNADPSGLPHLTLSDELEI